jgi:RND superfamily putative drug exporter
MGLPILTAVLGLVAGLSLITLAGHLIEVPTLAGGTVVIALCSLVLAGISEVSALGYTAAIVVVTAVLAAITLLPALLALLGSRVNPLAIPVLSRRHDEPSADPDHSRGWQRWARRSPGARGSRSSAGSRSSCSSAPRRPRCTSARPTAATRPRAASSAASSTS